MANIFVEEFIPRFYGNNNTIILERSSFDKNDMNERLRQSVENESNVEAVHHQQLYAIYTNEKWRRAMLKFHSVKTGSPTLTLVDEMGPMLVFEPGCSTPVRSIKDRGICAVPFAIVKFKLYGLAPSKSTQTGLYIFQGEDYTF